MSESAPDAGRRESWVWAAMTNQVQGTRTQFEAGGQAHVPLALNVRRFPELDEHGWNGKPRRNAVALTKALSPAAPTGHRVGEALRGSGANRPPVPPRGPRTGVDQCDGLVTDQYAPPLRQRTDRYPGRCTLRACGRG